MRSYGSYDVSVSTSGGDLQHYTGSAVENNTNPLTGEIDPDYANQVSFLGGGVIPGSVWVSADSYNADGSRKMRADINPTTGEVTQVWDVTIVEAGTAGARLHTNAYGGFAFLMRADGTRILQTVDGAAYDPALDYLADRASWTDYPAVAAIPEPETYAMMLAGLGLVGTMAARRRRLV
ncbi:MAG: FxDxF family PEP-CTERM protein [Thiobacillus sp.]|nr:FxDxF family PEP-CTERM protein [Thiobacillus sp.]